MKVQIFVDSKLVNTQIVSETLLAGTPSVADVKRLVLKQALADNAIRISDALRASFQLFDLSGNPVPD